MTYWLINLPFLAVAAAFTVWGAVRAGRAARTEPGGRADATGRAAGADLPSPRRYWAVWAGTTAILLALTAVFDNLMIAAGLFTYSDENISGVHLGLMPVEDFTYSLAAAWILVPLLLTGPGRGRPGRADDERGRT